MPDLPVILPEPDAAPDEISRHTRRSSSGGFENARLSGGGSSIRRFSTEGLAQSLDDIRSSLDDVFSSMTEVGHFQLSEIQLTLELTAEGGFALLGSAKAGVKGGITLSFAPPRLRDER